MDNEHKSKIIALSATLGFALLSTVVLCCCSLTRSSIEGRTWPPEHHSEIILDQEQDEVFVPVYAAKGDNILEPIEGTGPGQSDVTTDEPTQVSHDAVNSAPTEGRKTNVTTSEQESPAKVKKDDKPVGNANPDEEAKRAEAQRQQQATQNADKLTDRFSGRGTCTGNADNKDNADGTNASGGNSSGRGLGMTASADVRPPSTQLGTIVVDVIVRPDGTVRPGSASINVQKSKGLAADNNSTRKACLNAAYKCKFSRQVGESNELPGTITFKWE